MNETKPTVLVTGASRGIGRSIAIDFGTRGYHVIVNYRREKQEAETTLAAIETAGGTGETRRADISKPEQVTDLFRGLRRLDVLVNNAGITRDGMLLTMRPDNWKAVLATNMVALFHCSKHATRLMCGARQGVIVNIGSSSAMSARIGQTNYSTAKAALMGFSRSIAREFASSGIRVATVAPGFTATDMAQAVPDAEAQATIERIPLRRWARPQEVVRAVAFVASDAARCFSGQTLIVDGGRTAFETEMGL